MSTIAWTRRKAILIFGSAIVVAVGLYFGIQYMRGAFDDVDMERVKSTVVVALDARKNAAVTPGEADTLHPLTPDQLDMKYAAAEARLRVLFTGSALDDELFGLNNEREAERDMNARIVGGGGRVLEWNSVDVDGDTAHATGLGEGWLDTAYPDADGQYTVGPGYSQAHFDTELHRRSERDWIVTDLQLTFDVPGYRP
ncbi:hypothetical protein [Rhodococcus jostii]|uniref:hypothetical protein n=1 Tax=Rhodococcus jostii TaxID=132919 RepID=UPI003639BD31